MRATSSLGRIYIGHAVYEISALAIDSPRSRHAISLRRRDATRREKSRNGNDNDEDDDNDDTKNVM